MHQILSILQWQFNVSKKVRTWLSISLPLSALFALSTFTSGRMNLRAEKEIRSQKIKVPIIYLRRFSTNPVISYYESYNYLFALNKIFDPGSNKPGNNINDQPAIFVVLFVERHSIKYVKIQQAYYEYHEIQHARWPRTFHSPRRRHFGHR